MATSGTTFDTGRFEETANRIRELNERMIQLAKESGENSLDTYEKALQSLLDFEKDVAGNSQLDWLTALADTHVKFVRDLTGFYVNAARQALK